MVTRNIIVLAIGLVALAFGMGQQVAARNTATAPPRSIDVITVDLDPMIGRTTERIGVIASSQAKKGYALVGTINCQQQLSGGIHDTVILVFEK